MKAIFITSLICTLMSVVAAFVLSTITIVPGPGGESRHSQMMLLVGVFCFGWLCLAYWARPRQRNAMPSRWLTRSLIFAGVVYVLLILSICVG